MVKFRIGLIAIILTTILLSSCNHHVAQKKEETQKFYSCPMHRDYISYQPGKCFKCGMALETWDLDNMPRKSSENSHNGGSGSGAGSSGGHHH